MDELVKLLDSNLKYINHKIDGDTIYIWIESISKESKCPYCGEFSRKVHSGYEKRFKDLPIQSKKVIMILKNKKFFCSNTECSRTTFAQTYTFINSKSKRTKRLEEEIVNLSINVSSITASNILSESIAKIGKSTICNLLKKRNNKN